MTANHINPLHKKAALLLLLLLFFQNIFAHNINYALEKAPTGEVALFYLKLGVLHIIPFGLDHILFVVSLCLLNNRIKTIIWQATAFTIAHSITLALSMKSLIQLPSAVVEPVIALSIVFVSIENMVFDKLKPWRIFIIFLFGLIHGLGFAGVLNEIGLPPNQFFTSIVSFNLGVELGQVGVILLVYFLLILPFGKKPLYKKIVVNSLSVMIALVAAYWTFQRINAM